MARAKHTGREQRRHTRTARARTPSLAHFYRFRAPAITPGDFTFRLELLRRRDPPLLLDRMVDTLSWDDEQSGLTGNFTAYRPQLDDPTSLPVTRGQLVRCKVEWAGGTYVLWTMRTKAPVIELETGNVSVDLEDDMALLKGSRRDWWYRKTKRRPHGYTCDEVAREVGRVLGVKVRMAVKGKRRFELKMRNATGLAVLQAAYQREKDASGRSFIIRLVDGQLEITQLARNPMLYVLSKQIQTAALSQKTGSSVPTTVLTGRGRVGKGKATKSVTFTEYDRRVVNLLGYVHDTHDFGRVDSHAELRAKTKAELAKRLRLNDKITITHQGIPFIRRGDGTEIDLPAEGYKVSDGSAFVFCTRANHTVQAGTYQTTFDFNSTDPWAGPLAAEKHAKGLRGEKRSLRDRNLGGVGRWITVDSTYYGVADSGGPPACGGDFSYNGGLFFAELGFSGGAGLKLGPLFGMSELPCGFALEIRNPANGKSAIARKHDTGAGAPGARLDCWHVLADAIGFTSIGHGPLQIRRAQ